VVDHVMLLASVKSGLGQTDTGCTGNVVVLVDLVYAMVQGMYLIVSMFCTLDKDSVLLILIRYGANISGCPIWNTAIACFW